jgi:hypothetical protein
MPINARITPGTQKLLNPVRDIEAFRFDVAQPPPLKYALQIQI